MTSEDPEIRQWIEKHFSGHATDKENLVGVLLAMQEEFGYLSKTGMREIAGRMGLTTSNVYGVATFYNQFRFVPPGKYAIRMCMGTACVIRRSQLILDHWERRLGIKVGQVSGDREYSLDRVDCVGCCTLAPVSVIGDEVFGEMAVTKVDGILLGHRIRREQNAGTEDEGKRDAAGEDR